jgi:hypothetical protein
MKRFARGAAGLLAVIGVWPSPSGLSSADLSRTLTLDNMCPFSVYPGATVGAVGGAGNPVLCSNGACAAGQICNPTNNQCYWGKLKTSGGAELDGYTLELKSGSRVTIDIPIVTSGPSDTIWSGGIWAGTDVPGSTPPRTAASAATGYCAASQNGMWDVIPCADQITAPQNAPTTKAEFTLVNSQDTYDITAINGVSIPLAMLPTPGQSLEPPPPSNDPNEVYYWCKEAGAATVSETPARDCSWSFAATNNGIGMALVQHRTGAQSCGPTQACPSGQTCGIAFNSAEGVSGIYQECGQPLSGSWTAIQICAAAGYDNNNLTHVSTDLKQRLDCVGSSGLNTALFQCTGHGSCYSTDANASCCGCPDWPDSYKPFGGNAAAANRCYATNPDWLGISYPWLNPYVKQACPTMYSYQYDDVTSTFTCTSGLAKTNATNYTITFCPAGLTAEVAPPVKTTKSGLWQWQTRSPATSPTILGTGGRNP